MNSLRKDPKQPREKPVKEEKPISKVYPVLDNDLARDNVGVLLLVPGESFDGVRDQVEDEGVMALAKPLTRQTLEMGLHMITALRGKLLQMDRRNRALQEKMTDIRTINRAKWLLIEQLKMTEAEAHRHIEKQAMDRCTTRREIALGIIKTYA